jgi:hypothetical protein
VKTATLSQIRSQLKELPHDNLVELCTRLIRFKKDNKELAHYILYESLDENSYIRAIQNEVMADFESLNNSNLYLAKKTIRKVLRKLNKYVKYSGRPETVIELNIFFIQQLINMDLAIEKNKVLTNIFMRRFEIIQNALEKLHPDLQFDYALQMRELDDYLSRFKTY